MSQQDLDTVRRTFDGWARGDFSETDAFDPEIEFELVDWPEPAKAKGIDEMWSAWGATLRAWDDFRSVASEFIEADPHVVVLNRISARGKGSGVDVSADTACVCTLEGGKIVRLALYWDRRRALESVGLSAAEIG